MTNSGKETALDLAGRGAEVHLLCRLWTPTLSTISNISFPLQEYAIAELQKRADRADQSVLFFLAGANFWEKLAKNCAIISLAHITYVIAH